MSCRWLRRGKQTLVALPVRGKERPEAGWLQTFRPVGPTPRRNGLVARRRSQAVVAAPGRDGGDGEGRGSAGAGALARRAYANVYAARRRGRLARAHAGGECPGRACARAPSPRACGGARV